MKRTTLVSCDADALSRIGPAAVTLAEAEGWTRMPGGNSPAEQALTAERLSMSEERNKLFDVQTG